MKLADASLCHREDLDGLKAVAAVLMAERLPQAPSARAARGVRGEDPALRGGPEFGQQCVDRLGLLGCGSCAAPGTRTS